MRVMRVKDQVEGAQLVLDLLKESLEKGAKVLGLATGSTPIAFYEKLVASDVDTSDLVSVNLDEYVGLSADNDQSYAYFMDQHLFSKKPFKASFLPNGLAVDAEAETQRYNDLLDTYPIDFQILGIGQNGHIGFNEPGSPFDGKTRLVDLAESTIQANARFFEDESQVPRQAYSMGIANIMAAKTIVLLAYGASKAEAIYGMVKGPVTEDLPASALQNHDHVVVIVDEAAGALLGE